MILKSSEEIELYKIKINKLYFKIHIEKQVLVNLLKINLVEIVTLFKIKKNLNGLPIYLKIEQNITTFFLKKFFEIYKDKIYNIRFTHIWICNNKNSFEV